MYTHLRCHSYYSFLRGLSSPHSLVQATVQQGMSALTLTDYHRLAGAVEFYDACHAAGLQPILGLEVEASLPTSIPVKETGVLVLLAEDLSGWGGLCRISSSLEGEEGVLPFEQLATETRGLVCLTGGLRGSLARLILSRQNRQAAAFLDRLKEIFPNSLYVELQCHTPTDEGLVSHLVSLARSFHLPVVATQDIHYLTLEEAGLQKVVTAIRLNRPAEQVAEVSFAPPHAYFTSILEMQRRFADYPGALYATQEITSRCKFQLPVGVLHFPEFPLPDGQNPLQELRSKALDGARRLYGMHCLASDVQGRLDHELSVIGECGYASLFLIMEEIVRYARQIGVPISSRGSAASSLVAHCLGITSPDPIRLNLYFERFLNPARATPPDIDTDLCSRRRDEVIRFVYDRYGTERVATVCTVNRFRSRSALREVAKAYGLPPDQVDRLCQGLPHGWFGPPWRSEKEAPFAELVQQYRSPTHQAIFRDAAAILGTPHHLSVHPGGIVIAPGRLTDLVPTQMAAKGVRITQFDLDSIERMGLVKIDLLGIRGLTVLGDVAQALFERTRQPDSTAPVSSSIDLLEAIPETDPETSELVRQGRTIGCFQIESPGMRATLREIQASSVDDIMIALALYRPGPLTGGLKDAFVRRHRGQETVEHLHPSLAGLLEDTYGVILYQEQVLRIAHELAGLSLADADLLRRAMSHFDPGKQMQTLKEKFIAGASARNGVPAEVGDRIWELMAAFSGYGFPKAHAASYAQVGWRSAWCKRHYPEIFMAAVLANWGGYYPQRVYLTETRRLGLALRPPQVNYAEREFCVKYLHDKPVLFMGLDQVRDLTRRTQTAILQNRPFYSLHDFLSRADPRPVEAENLIKVGALEDFGPIPVLLRTLIGGNWQGGQLPLFSYEAQTADNEVDWTLLQKVEAQEVILGVGVIAHPLELVAGKISAYGALTTVEAASRLNQRVRVAGMRQTWRRSLTSRGDYIYFMSLEDLEGFLNVVITGEVYQRHHAVLSGPGPYVIEATVELDKAQGEPYIRAERIWRIEQ